MPPDNRPLDIKQVHAAYAAKFGPIPVGSEGGRYFPSPPLKWAINEGKVPELLHAMQAAIDKGVPMDLNALVRQVQAPPVLRWDDE
jgi:hypothetical protein